ncbi:GNAT family N-acetyltransferase [Microlunatus speluncae]|uniref:GNAT family N-acetyltransferase n=1 Tax=Microlunatus speluncae TaxID=2594267 RepID=UPI001266342A|nr:GNAT family N-acetyltransferase [Microlunatus speluncae]
MASAEIPPLATTLAGRRLDLEPLRVEHAEEMASVLDDPSLHTFTGGEPPTIDELRSRYARQVVGHSPDGSERWLNWIVRRRDDAQAIGFVQATVSEQDQQLVAEIAWVIGSAFQGQRYAQEAATVMTDWLRDRGVARLVALIHPDHEASGAVARKLGLGHTDELVDGEVRWVG